MLEKFLDNAAVAIRDQDEQRAEQLISQLAQSSDETVIDVLVAAFRRTDKLRQSIAIRALRLLGYPKNEPAIPELIYHIGDPNLPGWEEAVKTLLDIGPQVVVPYLVRALLDQDAYYRVGERSTPIWSSNVEGVCYFLTYQMTGQEYVRDCGPAIVFVLSQMNVSSRSPDTDLLLDVIEKARKPVEYALPVLIMLAKKHDTIEVRKHANSLILAFQQEVLAPYKLVLTSANLGKEVDMNMPLED